eukprot:3996545-Karenia_brevis.AAC.1
MDANSSFGLRKASWGLETIPSGALGGHNLGVENYNGHKIRALLEKHQMMLVQTTKQMPKSYTSCAHHTSAMIDHIAIPLR